MNNEKWESPLILMYMSQLISKTTHPAVGLKRLIALDLLNVDIIWELRWTANGYKQAVNGKIALRWSSKVCLNGDECAASKVPTFCVPCRCRQVPSHAFHLTPDYQDGMPGVQSRRFGMDWRNHGQCSASGTGQGAHAKCLWMYGLHRQDSPSLNDFLSEFHDGKRSAKPQFILSRQVFNSCVGCAVLFSSDKTNNFCSLMTHILVVYLLEYTLREKSKLMPWMWRLHCSNAILYRVSVILCRQQSSERTRVFLWHRQR